MTTPAKPRPRGVGAFAKFYAALLTGLAAWVAAAPADGHIEAKEWWLLAGFVITALNVWVVPNYDPPTFPSRRP